MGRLLGSGSVDVICSHPILAFFDSSALYYLYICSSSASHFILIYMNVPQRLVQIVR